MVAAVIVNIRPLPTIAGRERNKNRGGGGGMADAGIEFSFFGEKKRLNFEKSAGIGKLGKDQKKSCGELDGKSILKRMFL